MEATSKAITERLWFRLFILLTFLFPVISQIKYDPRDTGLLVADVLAHPLIYTYPLLFPIAKAILLLTFLAPFLIKRSEKVVLLYYAVILVLTALFQNVAETKEYGWVWIVGNTIAMLVVSLFCFADLVRQRTTIKRDGLAVHRLWIVGLVALAFFFPYGIGATGAVIPGMENGVLTNEAALTYCMITPVILGIFLLFPDGINPQTKFVTAFVGCLFGLMNMLTWFVLQPMSWWMGVLHLPLLILSVYGLMDIRNKSSRVS